MIGYYVHHQGRGHLVRAMGICAQLDHPVTALTSLPLADPRHPFDAVLDLPRDDLTDVAVDADAHGAFHWLPLHDNGLRDRMRAVAEWVAETRPAAVVVDVSVEIATLVRLLGVPVIVVAMPGDRTDAPHELAYRLADHILAAWPRELYEPDWLRPHAAKTSYVGAISRFDGRPRATAPREGRIRLLTLVGRGGSSLDGARITRCAQEHPEFDWTALGVAGGRWLDDPWDELCAADVVIAHAGQSSIADVAAAARPAIVVPEHRPFDEQEATAAVLDRAGLAVTHHAWPRGDEWPSLVARARAIDPAKWRRWQTAGAAGRAAAVIDSVAARRSPLTSP